MTLLTLVLANAAPAASQTAGNSVAAGMEHGYAAADSVGADGWAAFGLLSGFTFSIPGVLVTYVAAPIGATPPDSLVINLSSRSGEYIAGYQQGFASRLREQRRRAVLTSGIAGVVLGGVTWYLFLSTE